MPYAALTGFPASRRWLCFFAVAMIAAAPAVAREPQTRGTSCDRRCLARSLDLYLTALIDHAPARARLAKDFRGVENAVETPPGEGLWASVEALGGLQRRYYDPSSRSAVFYGSLVEPAGPALVSLRITVRDRHVIQAEALVSRAGDRLFNIAGAIANPPSGAATVAKASDRRAMIAAVEDFFDHLQSHSGEGVRRRPGCARLENGSGGPSAIAGASGHDCATGFEQLLQISAVAHRRVTAVDEKEGAVIVTAMFLRPPGATMPDGKPWKRNLFSDVFTFDGGLITGVYGVMHGLEAESPESTGWTDVAVQP